MNPTDDAAERPAAAQPSSERQPLVLSPARPASGAGVAGPRLDRRRLFLATAASGAGAAATLSGFGALAQESGSATPAASGEQPMQHPPTSQGAAGFVHLVPFEAAILQAAAARIIPSDDSGPGATEAGVVYFIDRQLYAERVGAFSYRGQRYDQGPYLPGEATQGDQSALPMADRFRLGILGMERYAKQTYGSGFAQLNPDQQDRILQDMEAGTPDTFGSAAIVAAPTTLASSGTEAAIEIGGTAEVGAKAFFELLLTYTIAGFFADPVHGGNRDMVGWKLIGFPGAQMSYADQILDYGVPFDGPYQSLAAYQMDITGGA